VVRKCLKCGFSNDAASGAPDEPCPRCGVIYAKAEAAARAPARPAPTPPVAPPKAAPREVRLPLWPTVACGVCLVVGFLAGREQMRYQLVSAFTGAMTHAFDGVAPANKPIAAAPAVAPPAPAKAPPPTKPSGITAKLLTKGFRDQEISGSHFVKAAITFEVEFHNDTDKDIRAFDGVLSFDDLLGNRVYAAKLTISNPIAAKQSTTWSGELEYNQFESDHTKLRGYDVKDTTVTLQVRKILFADGTSQTEGQG